MPQRSLLLSGHADPFAPILYGCLEHVGSTKGLLYLRQPDGGFTLASQYGWPRGCEPPAALEPGHPLLIQVQRARRSFAVNQPEAYPGLESFLGGGLRPQFLLSPVYLMGDWVALVVQRDRQRQEPFDEERDGPPTLAICEAIAQEIKSQRSGPDLDSAPVLPDPEVLFRAEGATSSAPNPELKLILQRELSPESKPVNPREPAPEARPAAAPSQASALELKPFAPGEAIPVIIQSTTPPVVHRSGTVPMDPAVVQQIAQANAAKSEEKLSGLKSTGEVQQVAWAPEPRTLPGTDPSPRAHPSLRRAGMHPPETRQYFWDMAALMCRMAPVAAVALWWEDPSELRPLLCYSGVPLSPAQLQEVLAQARFHLPQVSEQELRIITRPGREDLPMQEGGFSTQSTLPVGVSTGDLLMVFRREYAPLSDLEIRSLSPGLRLLQEYLEEARVHDRYHHAFLSFAQRILANVDSRVPGLRAHSLGCTKWCRAMALRLDLPSREAEALEVASLLHDVGMLMLDPALHQKSELTPDDRLKLETHPMQAAGFLKDLQFPFDVMGLIEAHHERWDGTGYPLGLGGEDIPRCARILAIADAYDCMVQGRPYQPAIPKAAAVAELEREAGRQFDPRLVATFLGILSEEP